MQVLFSLGSLLHPVLSFFLFVDGVIYDFIRYMYDIFIFLAGTNIFGEEDYSGIVTRIYLILGVVMMFALAYSLLKAVINPDEFAKGEKSFPNLIKNVVISLIIIALLPTVFRYATEIQNSIIDNDVIGKIILPSGEENSIEHAGNTIAPTIYEAFLYPNPESNNTSFEEASIAVSSGDTFRTYADLVDDVADGDIIYNFPFSTIAGLFVLWVLLLFCFDLGIRVVKLLFLQIIAPIPVICRILPNDKGKNVWGNWVKKIVSTYLEVFIRLIVMYIGVYLIILIKNNLGALFSSDTSGLSASQTTLAQIFVILGVFAFMRIAPKLISELFGLDSSGLDIGLKGMVSRLGAGGIVAAAGAGAIAGGVTSATRNAANAKGFRKITSGVGGFFGGAGRGLTKGGKAKSFADFRKGTSEAINATTGKAEARSDKRDERQRAIEEYMNKNGVSKYKAARAVAVQNAKDTMKAFAGIDEIKDLLKDNEIINGLASKKSAVKNNIESLIDGEANKASSNLEYNGYSAEGLRDRLLAISDAKAGKLINKETGEQISVSQAQKEYDEYRKKFADELEKVAYNDRIYASIGKQLDELKKIDPSKLTTEQAKQKEALNKLYVKMAGSNAMAHEVKEELARHLDKDYVKNAGFDATNVLGDYSMADGTPIKEIGDILDLKLAENNREIAKIAEEKRKKDNK